MNGDPTIIEVLDTLTDIQKQYVYCKVGEVLDGLLSVASAANYVLRRPGLTKEQKTAIILILEEANNQKKGENK